MAEERRAGYSDLLESIKDFKQDIKEDIKEIKDELKQIDIKVNDHITTNNKFYFNGFQPDKHVADHHIIDTIIEKVNESKGLKNKLVEEVLKVAVVAALTFIAISTWNGIKEEVKPPFENKPKVEQNVKGH
jgi:archaellum component FlaC